MTGGGARRRPMVGWALAFAGLWLLALAAATTAGLNTGDEVWFLQVLSRVTGGEVLYRDVFFNTTPASVQLGALLVPVFGVDIFVVKLLLAGAVALSSVCCAGAVRTLGGDRLAAALVALGGVAFGASALTSPYTPLAVAALCASLLAVLRWRAAEVGAERRMAWLIAAGAAVGAAFACKHSLGVSAGAALATALVLERRAVTLRGLALTAAAAGSLAAVPIAIALTQGGGPKLWEYGVTAKGAYVEQAGVSWTATMADIAGLAAAGPTRGLVNGIVPLLPVVAALLVVLALAVGTARATTTIVAAFALAGLFNAYPRADEIHFLPVAPLLILCIWVAADQLPTRGGGAVRWAGAFAVAGALVVVGVAAAGAVIGSSQTKSSVPHLRGMWLPPAQQQELIRGARALRDASRGQPTLVIASDAGGRYLTAGVQNVTPFDFPLASAFGLHGQADVAAQVRSGRFELVCLSTSIPPSLRARKIEAAVDTTMVPGALLGTCRAHRPASGG